MKKIAILLVAGLLTGCCGTAAKVQAESSADTATSRLEMLRNTGPSDRLCSTTIVANYVAWHAQNYNLNGVEPPEEVREVQRRWNAIDAGESDEDKLDVLYDVFGDVLPDRPEEEEEAAEDEQSKAAPSRRHLFGVGTASARREVGHGLVR